MINNIKSKLYKALKWSEKYAKTDMVYLAKGGFWLTLGQIISNIASLLLSVAFANLLSPEVYGTYRYILSACGILAIPALSGMSTSLTQAVARGFEGSVIPAIKTRIRWGLFGGIASLILAGYYYFGNNQQLAICFLIAAVFLPFMDAISTYDAVLAGKKDFRRSTLYFAVSQIICSLALIIITFFSQNLYLLVGTYFLFWTLLRLIFLLFTLRKYRLNKKIDGSAISYGKHLSLMGIIGSVSNYLDRLLLFHYLGPVEVAVYSMAIAPPEQLKGLFKNINTLALPKFSEKYGRNSQSLLSDLWPKMFRFFLLTAILTAIYIVAAPLIYKIFFPKYINAVFFSQIYALSVVSIVVSLPISVLQAQAAKKQLYIINSITSIAQIIFLFIFIKFFGIMGAIVARLFSRGLIVVLLLGLIIFDQGSAGRSSGETDFNDNALAE